MMMMFFHYIVYFSQVIQKTHRKTQNIRLSRMDIIIKEKVYFVVFIQVLFWKYKSFTFTWSCNFLSFYVFLLDKANLYEIFHVMYNIQCVTTVLTEVMEINSDLFNNYHVKISTFFFQIILQYYINTVKLRVLLTHSQILCFFLFWGKSIKTNIEIFGNLQNEFNVYRNFSLAWL